ncbi:MAG TPA: DPP IV N-terminal domain-containing protein, partial [Anaerolineaceae bacterium]|nr:DPP IV N-terminal domain-containing protein [Anaerolineaceae bacterium]
PTTVTDLDLTFVCGFPEDTVYNWRVSNPNAFPVNFTWQVIGGTESGSGTALANGQADFTTSAGPKTVRILVGGLEIDLQDSGAYCFTDLTLSYVCEIGGAHHIWTVNNPNAFSVGYDWSVEGSSESGSGTVSANGTDTFQTSNASHTVNITYRVDTYPTRSQDALGEICSQPSSTPTVTPTPTQTATPKPTVTEPPLIIIPPLPTPAPATCPQWIIFHTFRDQNLEVYRLDGVEGQPGYKLFNLSRSNAVDSRPSRSPNDAWVVFESNRDGNVELYYTDSGGNAQVRLTNTRSNNINAMFGRDSNTIAFQSDRTGNWDIFQTDRTTKVEKQLTINPADDENPYWSPNLEWVAFQSNRNGNWDIYLLNVPTGNEFQLTNSPADEIYPAWSPNAKQIAFLTLNPNGIYDLYVVDIDGQNLRKISAASGDSGNHSWSPEGYRIAYQSERDGNLDIYTYDLRTDKEYRLTDYKGADSGPTWDCGGTNIAYTSTRDETTNIFQVYWQGGGSSNLTIHPATDKWSQWSPSKESASRGK